MRPARPWAYCGRSGEEVSTWDFGRAGYEHVASPMIFLVMAFSRRSRASSARSSSLSAPFPAPRRRPVQHHPVAQGPLVDAQLPGHLRDRPAGLPDNPDRALPEILIKPPP